MRNGLFFNWKYSLDFYYLVGIHLNWYSPFVIEVDHTLKRFSFYNQYD